MSTTANPTDPRVLAWLRDLVSTVDASNYAPDTPCAVSPVTRLLTSAPVILARHAGLASADLNAVRERPLREVRSDVVCREFSVDTTPGSINLMVARMTVPGGPWPGHFGLEAIAFSAVPALPVAWFPAAVSQQRLVYGNPIVASQGFARGGGAVLFPEQLSVKVRPMAAQAFGVVFLPKLTDLFVSRALPVLDATDLEFDPAEPSALAATRQLAFNAHEWGHNVGAQIEQGTAIRRRRLAAVLSELHADLAALVMLTSHADDIGATAAARMLVFDRVVREAWLPRAHAQVDAIAARHLLNLLASNQALWFSPAGLRLDLDAAQQMAVDALGPVAEVMGCCGSGDLEPAARYLTSSGWRIDGTACHLDLGVNLGCALARPISQAAA